MLLALTTTGMASKLSSEVPSPSVSSGITGCDGESQWLSQVLLGTDDSLLSAGPTPCSIALRTPASLRNGSMASGRVPVALHRAPLARGQAPVAHHAQVAYNANVLKARGAETWMPQSCASPHLAPPSPEMSPAARTLISDRAIRQAARCDVIANPHTQAMLSAWAHRQSGRQPNGLTSARTARSPSARMFPSPPASVLPSPPMARALPSLAMRAPTSPPTQSPPALPSASRGGSKAGW